ncbi:putative thioredoxin [Nakamurella panacisegetis]|uniref:Putative thioredoxin n=1 Tax=Nakamurella panacisegetis TaxID=1090615 RepID=A0A1H0RMN9_9ACTN|nr:tetratricopeptide repeat protein [Nakamurella panacisegetis]SDP30650.1 putative thioredoxin [Nakamurella panacisegetis]
MTRPDRRQQAALSTAFAGAIDLSALANRPAPGAAPAPDAKPPSKYNIDVTEATFGEVVQASTEVLVVFDLWSARSALSASLSAILNDVVDGGHGAWVLARIDVDTNPRVAQAFQAREIPTIIAVAGGQPVDAYAGPADEKSVRTWITGLLDALRDRLPGIKAAEDAAGIEPGPAAPEEDPRFLAAEDALMVADYETARTELEQILAEEPGNERATAALAQTLFLAHTDALPADTVAAADADPDNVPLQCDAADIQVSAGEVQAAFDRLIGVVKRTAGDERTAAREHLLSLFGLFAVDDDQVKQARRALAAALY